MTGGVIIFRGSLLTATSGCSLRSKTEIDSSNLHKTIRKSVKAQQNESTISSNIFGLSWMNAGWEYFSFALPIQHFIKHSNISFNSFNLMTAMTEKHHTEAVVRMCSVE